MLITVCRCVPVNACSSVQGYRLLVGFSRRLCLALLCRPRLELLKITKDVDEGCVRARWRLVGSLRLLHFAERWATVSTLKNGRSIFLPVSSVCVCVQGTC